jgi:hypothetical protein
MVATASENRLTDHQANGAMPETELEKADAAAHQGSS